MTKWGLTLQIIAVTLIALIVAFFWALDPILTAIFWMSRPGETDADMIRQIWHFRLVQPDWIGTSDQLWRWQRAETYARLAVVFAGWIGSVVALTMRYRRGKRRHLTCNAANGWQPDDKCEGRIKT